MNWLRVRLTKLAEIIMGQSPPGKTYSKGDNSLPFFQDKVGFEHMHPIKCIGGYRSIRSQRAVAHSYFDVAAPMGLVRAEPAIAWP